MRLVDYFTAPMAYATCLVGASPPEPFETARPALETLLQTGRDAAHAAGMEPADIEDAFFAACAFIDEVVLGSNWDGRELWIHQPLQRVYCGTVNAGDEFFDRLAKRLHGGDDIHTIGDLTREATDVFDGLGRAQPKAEEEAASPAPAPAPDPDGIPRTGSKAVLEVYGVCLNMGFTGRYFTQTGYSELKKLQARTIRAIYGQRVRDAVPPASKLFPWLYPDGESVPLGRRVFWRGLDAVDAALVVAPVVIAAGLYFLYNRQLSSALSGFLGFGP